MGFDEIDDSAAQMISAHCGTSVAAPLSSEPIVSAMKLTISVASAWGLGGGRIDEQFRNASDHFPPAGASSARSALKRRLTWSSIETSRPRNSAQGYAS